jgi:hypothetical protein
MPVGRRTAAGRDVHVNETVPAIGVVPGKQNRVGIPDESYVRKALIGLWSRDFEFPPGVIGRKRGGRFRGNRVPVHRIIFLLLNLTANY